MKLETLVYEPDSGWSGPIPTGLDSENSLLLVFGSSAQLDDSSVLEDFLRQFPNSLALGCSTAGEIFDTAVMDDSLSVAVARFERSQLRLAEVPMEAGTESLEAGQRLGEALKSDDLKAVFVLSDGLKVNGSDLVRGINASVGDEVVVTGGLAGDGERFERTWVLHQGMPTSGFVTAVGLYGDAVRVGHGSKGGWDIFGPEREVTRSEANVLYELDGRPALALYKEYLGELAEGLPATGLRFPLALRESADAEKQLVRTILAVDEANQSMTFAGDIPQGWKAQLMRANFDRLVDGAETAAERSLSALQGTDEVLAVAISCVGRRMVLGARIEDETEATLDALPENTHQVGFYSYGELSPYASGACDLHNQTMTLTTFSEA